MPSVPLSQQKGRRVGAKALGLGIALAQHLEPHDLETSRSPQDQRPYPLSQNGEHMRGNQQEKASSLWDVPSSPPTSATEPGSITGHSALLLEINIGA